jgi:DNA-binding transcriptional LysR family regulator
MQKNLNWTLDELTAFATTVQTGSFSAAGRKLNKVQSRISTAVSNLEITLGFELFDRSGRLPVLTIAGKAIYVKAQAILSQCLALDAQALSIMVGEEVSLTIGIDEGVPSNAIDEMLNQIFKTFPRIQLTTFNGNQSDIYEKVANRQCDLGIAIRPQKLHNEMNLNVIGHCKMLLVASHTHPLATLNKVTDSDLKLHRQFVICDSDQNAFTPPISSNCCYSDSYYHLFEMVVNDLGWAILPAHIVQGEWLKGALKPLNYYEPSQTMQHDVGLIRRLDAANGPVTQWLVEKLKKLFQQ